MRIASACYERRRNGFSLRDQRCREIAECYRFWRYRPGEGRRQRRLTAQKPPPIIRETKLPAARLVPHERHSIHAVRIAVAYDLFGGLVFLFAEGRLGAGGMFFSGRDFFSYRHRRLYFRWRLGHTPDDAVWPADDRSASALILHLVSSSKMPIGPEIIWKSERIHI